VATEQQVLVDLLEEPLVFLAAVFFLLCLLV
jgi:hypothetical protein